MAILLYVRFHRENFENCQELCFCAGLISVFDSVIAMF